MKVQIVMPAINLWNSYTKPAIESVNEAMMRAHAHGIECRLLFIDNASTDETKVEAGKLVSTLFAHKRNEERWGFQRSVNYGVNDAFERGFDLALVLNNDVLMHPESIWRIAERFQGDAMNDEVGIGMVTCMDVSSEMKEKGMEPQRIGELSSIEKEAVEEAPHPCFSAFAVNKFCWDLIGEFDEVFFPAYFEDNDYHYRMQVEDLLAIVYPPAMFYHFASKTSQEASETKVPIVSNGMFENNRATYTRKWGGQPTHEIYKTPYNDPMKTVRSTEQNSTI